MMDLTLKFTKFNFNWGFDPGPTEEASTGALTQAPLRKLWLPAGFDGSEGEGQRKGNGREKRK